MLYTKLKFIAVSSSLLLALLLCGSAHATKAPDFSLPGTKGETILKDAISLKRYKNKTIYVDFWASWCVPCKQSFPWMNEMQERYASKGFKVIAINLDEDRSEATKFLKKVPVDFVIAYDPEGKTAESYQLKVMPTSYLINKKGELVAVHKGFKNSDKEAMEEKIKDLVK